MLGSVRRPEPYLRIRGSLRARQRAQLRVEALDPRTLLSATALASVVAQPASLSVSPSAAGQNPQGYLPNQIRQAYGFDKISFPNGVPGDGSGQTIAIIDPYVDPNIAGDLAAFDAWTNLPSPPSLTQVNQTGGNPALAPIDPTGGWALETALDVEWAHAMAPGAKILLVEADSATIGDLLAAVDYASRPTNQGGGGASVVSMSWGGGEFPDEAGLDSHFQQPGVTYIAASGDNGAGAQWPAASADVLAVGGTVLSLDQNNNRIQETGWSGSGGGLSLGNSSEPSYQSGYAQNNSLNNRALMNSARGVPDVAFASGGPGFAVYDSFPYLSSFRYLNLGWVSVGGTSAGAPQWAGLIAIADQGRGAAGSLSGAQQTLPALYQLASNSTSYSSDFFDITSGSNGPSSSAQPGYDTVTGLGSPRADHLAADLANIGGTRSTPLIAAATSPSSSGSGTASGPAAPKSHSKRAATPAEPHHESPTNAPFASLVLAEVPQAQVVIPNPAEQAPSTLVVTAAVPTTPIIPTALGSPGTLAKPWDVAPASQVESSTDSETLPDDLNPDGGPSEWLFATPVPEARSAAVGSAGPGGMVAPSQAAGEGWTQAVANAVPGEPWTGAPLDQSRQSAPASAGIADLDLASSSIVLAGLGAVLGGFGKAADAKLQRSGPGRFGFENLT